MRIAFRVDASVEIGTGHVMRCLTLAQALSARGVDCHFLSRELPGHLLDHVAGQGFAVHRLRAPRADEFNAADLAHSRWLGVDLQEDAREAGEILARLRPDWLICDHYALDARWERLALPAGTRLMSIDDLADRPHLAAILLDQNQGRQAADYDGLVPESCLRLIGPHHALLRPQFALLRPAALAARAGRRIHYVMISMGGIDLPNATSVVLEALRACSLPTDLRLTVVMGSAAPALEAVRALAARMPWPTQVRVNVADMATLMAQTDLAIGAVGTTTWERCCLGLPTLCVTIADNQVQIARALGEVGAIVYLGLAHEPDFPTRLAGAIGALQEPGALAALSARTASICDGSGTARVLDTLLSPSLNWRAATRDDAQAGYDWKYGDVAF